MAVWPCLPMRGEAKFLKEDMRNLNCNGKGRHCWALINTNVECRLQDEVTLLEKCRQGTKESRGNKMEMLKKGLYQSRRLLQMLGLSSSSSLNTEVRDNSIIELKNQLADALKEKDDLKLEKFETLSMKLTKLINSQISVNNKSGISFDRQMNDNELHDSHLNKSEMFESAYDSSMNEIEEENNQVNDRFKKVKGYHVVPPPYTGNYMPSRPNLSFVGLGDFVYKTNVSETITSVPRNESTSSKSSKDSLKQPKDVRPSDPIIEE
ncbi:hypothetical protein Tco_0637624 [Tanacetum coccineum]